MVRTVAIKVEDATHQVLTLLAQLGGRPLVDELREAIDSHIARRGSEVDLTAQAKLALAEIDRDANTRRKAIEALLEKPSKTAIVQPASKPARGKSAK